MPAPFTPMNVGRKIEAFDYAAESGDLPDVPFDEIVRLADDADADPETASRKLRSLGIETDDVRGLLYATYFDESTRRDLDSSLRDSADDYFMRTENGVNAMARTLGVDSETVFRARNLRATGNAVPYDLMKAEFYSR